MFRCTEVQPFLSLAAFAGLAKGGRAPGDLAAARVLGVRAQGGHEEKLFSHQSAKIGI